MSNLPNTHPFQSCAVQLTHKPHNMGSFIQYYSYYYSRESDEECDEISGKGLMKSKHKWSQEMHLNTC